jgi:hypothetical protein
VNGQTKAALRARLGERTAQLELAVRAGRRLRAQKDEQIEQLNLELAATRDRLASGQPPHVGHAQPGIDPRTAD